MRRSLGIVAAVVLGVVLLAVAAVAVFVKPDRIKTELLARVRAESGYAVDAGDASLAMGWSGAGIRVKEVTAVAPDSSVAYSLGSVAAYVRLLPLLKKRVELEKLTLESPRIVLRPEARQGAKAGGQANRAAALGVLAVKSWSIRNGSYRQTGPWGEFTLEDLDLEGSFEWTEREGGRGEAGGSVGGGVLAGAAGSFPLPGLRTSARFSVTPSMDSLSIEGVEIGAGPVRMTLAGGYSRIESGWQGEVVGRADPVVWADLEPLLPPALADSLRAFTIGGTVAMPELRIRQDPSGAGTFRGEVLLDGVSVKAQGAPAGLEGLEGRIHFTRDTVTLEGAHGSVAGSPLTLDAEVTGAGPREATVHLVTSVPGTTLGRLLPAESPIRVSAGNVRVDVTAHTSIPGPRIPRLAGRILLEGLAGSYRDLPIRRARGTVRFTGGGAEIAGLGAEIGKSDFELDATVPNLAAPWGSLEIRCGTLDLDELAPPGKEAGGQPAGSAPAVGLPGEGTIEIGKLRTRGLEARAVRAKVRISLDGVELRNIRGTLHDGDLSGDLSFRPEPGGDTWRYEGSLGARGVRVGSALSAWFPLAQYLEGTLEGSVDLSGRAGAAIDPQKALTMIGDIRLADGNLQEVGFLTWLGQFVRIPELSGGRWPFRSLATHFVFREGALEVEGAKLTQAGVDWQLAGRIGVDGILAMSGTVRADPDRLRLPATMEFLKPYLAEADGRVPLDFKLDGPAAGPRVTLDWAAVNERALMRAKSQGGDKLKKEVEEKFKNLLGGKKGGGG